LLDEQNVTGMGISEQPEQLRPRQLRARLVLGVPRDDLDAALSGEGLELVAGAVGVLFVRCWPSGRRGRSTSETPKFIRMVSIMLVQLDCQALHLNQKKAVLKAYPN